MKIKLNKDLGGYKKGNIMKLQTSKNGVVLNQYWRRRLEEAKMDAAVEILKEKQIKNYKKKKTVTEEGEENDSN